MMFEGKVNAAIRMLCESESGGVLPMSDETKAELKKKHPPPADIIPESLLNGPIAEVADSYFSKIDEGMILRATKLTKGAAGPSHTDGLFFRYILTHKNFKDAGKQLREEFAKFAKLIATRSYRSDILDSYVNCRLIPLDKCPGIRPIGIGETFRRIIGKTLSWVLKQDIQEAAGPLQVCTGIKSGSEAAVHFMREQFQLESSEAVILVDAANAFNAVNRKVLLHNIRILCPEFSTIAINMYRSECRLFVGGTEISSQEGTTQGDNLAMSLFAIATLPVLRGLERHTSVKQAWLADDATGAGDLVSLRQWWEEITTEGVKYGYYVQQSKSFLILKNPELFDSASRLFWDTSINIATDGKRHLGAVLGSEEFRDSYIKNLICDWTSM